MMKVFFIFILGCLSEEVEAHGLVGLFLGLLLLLLSGGGGVATSGSGGTSSGGSATGRHRGELAHALSDDLVDVLAVELGEDLVELLGVDVGADGFEDLGDGGLGGGGAVLVGESGQHVSSDVFHGC